MSKLRLLSLCISLLVLADLYNRAFGPSPVIADNWLEVGLTPDTLTHIPGTINLHPGDSFYLDRHIILSRAACLTLQRVFGNQFGSIRIPSGIYCFHKGFNDHIAQITIPKWMPPQLWVYQTSVKYSWLRDPDPMSNFRVCLMYPNQSRKANQICPSRAQDLSNLSLR